MHDAYTVADESQMSQVDGEWEGDDDDGEDVDEGNTSLKEGKEGTKEGGNSGGGEEELHTPKLSQRGLQLRAQMMKYGLSIFNDLHLFIYYYDINLFFYTLLLQSLCLHYFPPFFLSLLNVCILYLCLLFIVVLVNTVLY